MDAGRQEWAERPPADRGSRAGRKAGLGWGCRTVDSRHRAARAGRGGGAGGLSNTVFKLRKPPVPQRAQLPYTQNAPPKARAVRKKEQHVCPLPGKAPPAPGCQAQRGLWDFPGSSAEQSPCGVLSILGTSMNGPHPPPGRGTLERGKEGSGGRGEEGGDGRGRGRGKLRRLP